MPFRDVAPGPPSEPRALAPGLFLDRIEAEGFEAGVTRLADLTGLDRIGFPVWQAVRPFGRAQSVHQGKHASNLLARIGALGEALESHRAENAVVNISATPWRDLPASARCPDPHDCNADRGVGEACGALDWCAAREFNTGDEFFLPHLFVSLDFTLTDGHWLERSSAGLALGTCESEAIATGLLEVLERDAVGAWERSSPAAKAHGQGVQKREIAWVQNQQYKLYRDGTLYAVSDRHETEAIAAGASATADAARAMLQAALDSMPNKAAKLGVK